MSKHEHKTRLALVVGLILLAKRAEAASAGAALPWDAPLTTLQQSLTGPVALAISIIALGVTGYQLSFGGEMSDFTRRMCIVVMAVALLLAGASVVTALFPGASGAVIP